ncbi:hypothetical protein Tco_1576807 [Tanacetum coccineum]
MDANKKIDLDNPLCPNESKILTNILQNHPVRFSIAASSSVPLIYLGQFWHTLKEDGSKFRLLFVLNRKELTMTLDDFRMIFQLPQATDNNHERFVATPMFSEMVPFSLNNFSFTLELRSPSNFNTTGLVQPWQTLCKMFSRCLTKRVTRLHYSLEHLSTLIPYPRFTKLIISHMIAYLEISRRVRDKNHNLEHDEMVKSIFNSGNNKVEVRMKISSWMITDEMKLIENYRMYAHNMERQHSQVDVAKMIADAIQQECENLRAEITSRINNAITNHIPSHVDSSVRNYMSSNILYVNPNQDSQAFAQEQQFQLYLTMKDNPQLQHDDLPHSLQKTSEHGTYVFGESSFGQVNESEPGPSTSAFGRHLEEIHVTWAHWGKKQTRLRTNTKTIQDLKS